MENNKKNNLPIEHLSDEQLDDLLKYSQPFTEENLKNIQARFTEQTSTHKTGRKKPKKIGKKLIILAASATLLVTVGFSQKDNLKKAYYQLFGTHAEKVLMNSDKLTESVEDQGLRLKALATFKDGDTTYFLSELTDLTENRLASGTIIDNWQMNGGGNSHVMSYDEKTKTATILTTAIAPLENEKVTPGYLLKSFFTGKKDEEEVKIFDFVSTLNEKATWLDLSKQEASGGGADEEQLKKYGLKWEELNQTGLKPLEINHVLSEKQQVILSNSTYKDDFLHLQIKSPNTIERFFTFVTLIDTKTEEEIQPMASFSVDEGTHSNETGRSDYDEMIFDISKEKLGDYKLKIVSREYETIQNGFWAIKLKEPQPLPTLKFEDQEIVSGDETLKLNDVRLSPLSLSFTYKGKTQTKEALSIKVKMKNGETIDYGQHLSLENNESISENKVQITNDYLDIEKVAELEINGVNFSFV
ncbi:hypothetical protein ACYSNW_12465 [Enterococcus sp. LJL99]